MYDDRRLEQDWGYQGPGRPLKPVVAGSVPCVQCGWCCRQCACPFGEWDEAAHACRRLVALGDDRHGCSVYQEILDSDKQILAPAFGAGCCSPLNPDRARLLGGRG